LRLLFLGRLVDWKAVDLLLESANIAALEVCLKLTVVGDGSIRPELEAQAKRLGLDQCVEFLGWQTQQQCARLIREQDVLVLPSLFECGGAVVLEAMAVGLPVISTNWGGPADYLDESCGILVEPSSRDGLIKGFAAAIVRLAMDTELRARLGANGRQRVVERFDWQKKIDRIVEIYQEAIATWPRSKAS